MSLVRFELAGKRALITGGAAGIGLATATLLGNSGCRLAINDLDHDGRLTKAVATLKEQGVDVIAVAADISDSSAATNVVDYAIESLGGLDFLINNAGTPNTRKMIPAHNLEAMDEDFWQRILSVNLMGPFWMTKAAASALKENNGAVVNTASVSAFYGGGSSLAYSVSKGALVTLTRELARGLAPDVRVNAIAPGLVNSAWQCEFEDMETQASKTALLEKIGQPTDYADTIVYLCCGAPYITGEVIMVTGGLGI